jgi:hypothetical protein
VARTTQQSEEPEQLEEQNEVTTPEDLGFQRSREIEVERVQVTPQVPDDEGYVQIRMAQTIEEFTYGNPHQHYPLLEGKIYRVPRHIAGYLDSLGYVYHR